MKQCNDFYSNPFKYRNPDCVVTRNLFQTAWQPGALSDRDQSGRGRERCGRCDRPIPPEGQHISCTGMSIVN